MTSVKIFPVLVFLLLIPVLLVSCNRTAGGGDSYSSEEELPDMVLHNAVYVFGQKGMNPLTMKAETITIYSGERGKTILEQLTFTQGTGEGESGEGESGEGESGEIEMQGSCDSATINGKNTVANLKGNVILHKKTDDFTLECDTLEWDDGKQTIKTESPVHVVYKDGTELKAVGFNAQLNDNVYEFGKIIEGRFVDEE